MNSYPKLHVMKRMYPTVGYVIIDQDDRFMKAHMTIDGRPLPYVDWTGPNELEIESLVLKMWHWEKTGKRLECPLAVPKRVIPKRQEPASDAPTKFGEALKLTTWMHNNVSAERVRVPTNLVEEYKTKGFIEGRNFTAYVDPKKAERVAATKKAEYLANLKIKYHENKKLRD